MGFRYRKSINLGGGFRINLSKSGIGYSWGTKGYRITKTANGTTRETFSIPGTGLSYVEEHGKRKNPSANHGGYPSQQNAVILNNQYDTQSLENGAATKMVSEGLEEMLAAARKTIDLKNAAVIGFWITLLMSFSASVFFVLTAAFAVMYVYVKSNGVIDLHYEIDADQKSVVEARMNRMIKITQCAKVWRVTRTSRVIDSKYAAGANNAIARSECNVSTYAPFPFRTNVKVASFRTRNETLLFLPDKVFIIQGSKIGALNYSDVSINSCVTHYVEEESVPKDAQIAWQTWQYVNKDGSPDRRFNNNRPIPVCRYGELELKSASGLNTVIMYSNPDV